MLRKSAYRTLQQPSAAKLDELGCLPPAVLVAARPRHGRRDRGRTEMRAARVLGRAEAAAEVSKGRLREKEVLRLEKARRAGCVVRFCGGGVEVLVAHDVLLVLPLAGDDGGERMSTWLSAIAERRGLRWAGGGVEFEGKAGEGLVPVLDGVRGTAGGTLEVGTMVWVDVGVKEDGLFLQPGFVAGAERDSFGKRGVEEGAVEADCETVVLFGSNKVLRKALGEILPFVPAGRTKREGVAMDISWTKHFENVVIGRAEEGCRNAGLDTPEWAKLLVIEHDLADEARVVWNESQERRCCANDCAHAGRLLPEAEVDFMGEKEQDFREEREFVSAPILREEPELVIVPSFREKLELMSAPPQIGRAGVALALAIVAQVDSAEYVGQKRAFGCVAQPGSADNDRRKRSRSGETPSAAGTGDGYVSDDECNWNLSNRLPHAVYMEDEGRVANSDLLTAPVVSSGDEGVICGKGGGVVEVIDLREEEEKVEDDLVIDLLTPPGSPREVRSTHAHPATSVNGMLLSGF